MSTIPNWTALNWPGTQWKWGFVARCHHQTSEPTAPQTNLHLWGMFLQCNKGLFIGLRYLGKTHFSLGDHGNHSAIECKGDMVFQSTLCLWGSPLLFFSSLFLSVSFCSMFKQNGTVLPNISKCLQAFESSFQMCLYSNDSFHMMPHQLDMHLKQLSSVLLFMVLAEHVIRSTYL